ncbi:MAG: tRNA pseudouridine(38-40) synthase TruA [Bacteroidetes bacterium]|nr:tRNA pseudouridine(38-40) synthase TruA [Bacteroidota bacterium]
MDKELKGNKFYNYKLTIEYDGTDFLGWQRQSYSKETIQGHLEEKLEVLLKEKITLYAAGRTDAGVHAINQIANFKTNHKIHSDKFLYRLNSQLPKSITVKKISIVPEKFHARFSAKQREYIYKISLRRKSIEGNYYCRIFGEPDFKVIDNLIKFFIGRKSFFPLTKKKDDKHNFICDLNLLTYKFYKSKGEIIFKLRADRFLHSMVRSILGCLIDAGRGNITVEEVKKEFNAGEKIKTQYLPAHALFLNKIYY